MTELEFDEVPAHYKKFVLFDFQGKRLGWVMEETEWEAVAEWNRKDPPQHASSAVGPPS